MMSRPLALVISIAIHAIVIGVMLRPRARPPVEIEIDPSPALAGETFEVPADLGTAPETAAASDTATVTETATATAPATVARVSTHHDGTSSAAVPPARFGAVGDRSATDVLLTFRRAYTQVASADTDWTTVPFGDAGSADVTLGIDEEGKLVRAELGPGGNAIMRRDVERTFALIRGRAFVATAPEIHVRVSAKVNPPFDHEADHGGLVEVGQNRFAIGGVGNDEDTTTFFALSIGRQIDIRVKQIH
jgi:hypothetical protein